MKMLYGEKQFWDVKRYALTEGHAKGVRCIDVDLGDLAFTLLEDRCLDIYSVKYKGRQVTWLSKNGVVAPTYYDPEGVGWLKSFCGGLLTTCGLLNVGPPCAFYGGDHGMNGRISNIPAQQVCVRRERTDDGFSLAISGTVVEAGAHGCNYTLRRSISAETGRAVIALQDEITNHSDIPMPLMLMYLINFGYPLVNPEAVLKIHDTVETLPMGGDAAEHPFTWGEFDPPTAGAKESVYVHRLRQTEGKTSFYSLRNRVNDPDMGADVYFSSDTLPLLSLRKNPRPGEYAACLAPGNNYAQGVMSEEENKTLRYVEPGETVNTTVIWRFV